MFMLSDALENADDLAAAELRAALARTQRQLEKARLNTEELVQATITAAKDATLAFGPISPVPAPKADKRRKREEVALWHLTDWQGAKVTASYDHDVMRERVMLFAQKAVNITNIQRADHPVKDCHIAFGGDMVEGLFNFANQSWEVSGSLHFQFVTVSRLIVDVVRYALANYENVTVTPEWGNHGRIGSKRDNVPKSDNIDRMTYELARQILAADSSISKRLTWPVDHGVEDIQRIEIPSKNGGKGYRALLCHGDEIGRSGFASPSAWQAAVNRWKAGAYKWDFNDCYIGHYHRTASEPASDGISMLYWTGSTESDNRYARDSMAASGVPSQRLHFINPDASPDGGRVTAIYQVWLDA